MRFSLAVDETKGQTPISAEEGFTKALRVLTSGRCCSVCNRRDTCLDTEETTLCSAFSPDDGFLRRLRHTL